MAAIKRYIKYMEWWNDDIAQNSIIQFCKDLERMCLDAGLVKSNIIGNMDTDNIILPALSSRSSGYTYISTPLSFDFNDSMQSVLPIRITFKIGFYSRDNKMNTNVDYWPIIPLVSVNISIIGVTDKSIDFICNTKSYNGRMSANQTNQLIPNIISKNYESSICFREGFMSINICPSTNYNENNSRQYNDSIIYFIIERSFDSDGYTGDNINVISNSQSQDYSSSNSSSSSSITIFSKNQIYSSTSLFSYVDLPSPITNGMINTFPVYHIDDDYSLIQSNNIITIPDNTILVNQVADVIIDGNTYKFIGNNNSSYRQYPGSKNAMLLTRFE